ncbi:MAG: helix-turn-helix transcriptional regulator [Alphaproteobacteria bacterium]|nr:helix-turn-helix transcriptional regulator [Alphaproteobacteria bacterium]
MGETIAERANLAAYRQSVDRIRFTGILKSAFLLLHTGSSYARGPESNRRAGGAPKKIAESLTDIDIHVGYRLQTLRLASGMTRAALGERIGITSKQVLKYEAGIARLDATRMFAMAHMLGVPVTASSKGSHDEPLSPAVPVATSASRGTPPHPPAARGRLSPRRPCGCRAPAPTDARPIW